MAFRDPKVLMPSPAELEEVRIRDSPETAAELARKWDQLGLLYVHDTPIHPLSLVRIRIVVRIGRLVIEGHRTPLSAKFVDLAKSFQLV